MEKAAEYVGQSQSVLIFDEELARSRFSRVPIKSFEMFVPCIYPHHLSHAASSLFLSSHQDSIAIVIDGVGEFDSTSIWHYKSGHIKRIGGCQIPNSIGLFYAAITSYLDFEVNEGEYKVMGLASYGVPVFADKLRALISANLCIIHTISGMDLGVGLVAF